MGITWIPEFTGLQKPRGIHAHCLWRRGFWGSGVCLFWGAELEGHVTAILRGLLHPPKCQLSPAQLSFDTVAAMQQLSR